MFGNAFERYYNTPDGGSGGGPAGSPAPSGSAAPPAAAPPPSAPAGAAPPAPGTPPPAPGTPPPSSAGTPPAGSQFSYAEDRSNWIPPRRLSEVAARAQADRQRVQQLEAMIAAGTGVRFQPGPEEVSPEIRQAREALNQVYPGLDKLVAKAQRLVSFIETVDQGGQEFDFTHLTRAPQFGEEINRRWEQHAEQTLQGVHAELAKDYGVDKLSPRQERMIGLSFMDWLEEDRTGARADRYARGDGGLKSEFLTEFRGGFVDPFRRTQDAAALAAGSRNRNLPPAPQGSGVAPPGAPQAPKSLDQVTDDAWNTFQAANSR